MLGYPILQTDSLVLFHGRYQVKALELIKESELQKDGTGLSANDDRSSLSSLRRQFSVPLGPDLSKDKALATQAAGWGLEVRNKLNQRLMFL